MVFKKYIYKHGKKIGPYYYQNIRSHDGKIKSVYLGANPLHHTKHKVRKPLFFLIIVLLLILVLGSLLFFLQNKTYLRRARELPPDFDVDQILLKVLIRNGEYIEKSIRVMNTGAGQSSISIEVFGLSDIVKADASYFSIKPGQTKIVGLNFSSFLPEQKIEERPGIYVGKLIVKSERASREIPIVAEIETRNVLFDMNLNPVAIERKVKQGSDTTIEVRLFNLESIDSVNVDVEYFVKDMNGNTIMTESETVVVKTQASFFKTISVPKNLKPGTYVFAAESRFGKSVGTSSYLFEVTGPEIESSFVQFCKNSVLCLGLSLSTILLLFALTAYFYFYIGAYLYEKFTGLVVLPKKAKRKEEEKREKEEEEEEKEAGREKRKRKGIMAWLPWRRESRQAGRQEGMRLGEQETEEIEASSALKEIYGVLNLLKKSLENSDADEANKLYHAARKIYVGLKNKEKHEAYDELTEMYHAIRKLDKEKRQEDIDKKKELEKGIAKKELLQKEGIKRQSERKEKLKRLFHNFFHNIGLYKTPEEKRQLALQREKEKHQKESERQQKEKERQEKIKESEKAKKEEEIRQQKEKLIEKKRREEELRQEEQRKELETKQRKKQIKKFLHKIGLYKSIEEKRQIALQREKEIQEKIRRQEEIQKQRELEKQKELEKKKKEAEQKRLENEKIWKERKKKAKEKAKEFFHKIGFYKTHKEKKEIALEKEKSEKAKKEEEIRQQKEKLIQKKRREEGLREEKERKEGLEQKRREEQRIAEQKTKEEELKKQKEDEEVKKRLESERQKHEQEKLQKKLQRQELISQIKAKLGKSAQSAELANSKLKKLESERRELAAKSNKSGSAINEIEYKILDKYKEGKELTLQRNSISDKYRRQAEELNKSAKSKKKDERWKIKEMRIKLAARENSLMKGLEEELSRLIPGKRSSVERWKRLEIKAKLALEEKKAKEELKNQHLELAEQKKSIESKHKKSLQEINKKQEALKNAIAELQDNKHKALAESNKAPKDFANKDREIQKTRQRLEGIAKEQEQLNAQLSKLKSELKGQGIAGLLKGLISNYRGKMQKAVMEKRQLALQEEARKQKELDKQKSELERQKEPEKKSSFDECLALLNDAKKLFESNEISKARAAYMGARKIYIGLSIEEKKKVYSQLMEMYKKVK